MILLMKIFGSLSEVTCKLSSLETAEILFYSLTDICHYGLATVNTPKRVILILIIKNL